MKIRHSNQGYAMIMTLVFLGITLIGVASLIAWASNNAKLTNRNNQYVASQYAAEAAVENVMAQMTADFQSQCLSNAAYYSTKLPTNYVSSWPVQYFFTDPVSNVNNHVYVSIGATQTNAVPLPPPYTGLNAFMQECEVAATATPQGQLFNVPATIREKFQTAAIPIFQFLIFYNVDLEVNAAQTLAANGPVFSNGGLWSGTPNVTFNSIVWSVGSAVNGTTDPFANYTGSGSANYTMAGQPVSGVKPLVVPVPGSTTNSGPSAVETLLQWPPTAFAWATAAAYSTNGKSYFANAAGLVISNSVNGINGATGTNIFVYYQDGAISGYLSNVVCDYYVITNSTSRWITNYVATNVLGLGTNIQYAGYTFITNVTFYDWREYYNNGNGNGGKGKTVQAVQFDVASFNAWLENTNLNGTTNRNGGKKFNQMSVSDKSHSLDDVYIYTSVLPGNTTLPAVRVKNGQRLHDSYGLSIATPFPLYVLGDFNVSDGNGSNAGQNSTTHALPAAFFSDSISVLSGGWDDGTTSKKPSTSTTTTINAACMGGIVQSDKNITGNNNNDSSSYSGGVENFFRLLENWSSTPFYYNGSIIVMFPSQYATNRWRQTGNYYGAPSRHWAFDTNFLSQDRLPPMAPQIKTLVRNAWKTQ